jgi:hypothetical protein
VTEVVPTHAFRDVPKLRKCLRCQAEFKSEGFGERICKRCKSAKSWRSSRVESGLLTGRRNSKSS